MSCIFHTNQPTIFGLFGRTCQSCGGVKEGWKGSGLDAKWSGMKWEEQRERIRGEGGEADPDVERRGQ